MAGAVNQPFSIDVVSDVICPWCFLGKRRLDKALAMVAGIAPEVTWRPFFLDPTIPPGGLDRTDYLTRKFGKERLATLHDPLVAAGEEDGVPYNFNRIKRTPNTRQAHALLQLAAGSALQHKLAERLFVAYWSEGLDVGDAATLVQLATDLGIDGEAAKAALSDPARIRAVETEAAEAQRIGVTGVPTFILANRLAIVGAHPAESLADAIRQAMQQASQA